MHDDKERCERFLCENEAVGQTIGGEQLCEEHLAENEQCEHCDEKGVAFNDDGEFLCAECLGEWALDEGYTSFELHGT